MRKKKRTSSTSSKAVVTQNLRSNTQEIPLVQQQEFDNVERQEETVEEMSAGDHDVEIEEEEEEKDALGEARFQFYGALKGLTLTDKSNNENESTSESSIYDEDDENEDNHSDSRINIIRDKVKHHVPKRYDPRDGSHSSSFLIPSNYIESDGKEDEPDTQGDKVTTKQSYVMKLFDRSVDLAQFDDSTPLYSICRSWVANQPKKPWEKKKDQQAATKKIKDEVIDDEEKENKLKAEGEGNEEDNDEITGDRIDILHINRLPPPTYTVEGPQLRIPKLLPRYHDDVHEILPPESKSLEELPTREELMRGHLSRWTKIKKTWSQASQINEERYKMSKEMLEMMLNRSQKDFPDP